MVGADGDYVYAALSAWLPPKNILCYRGSMPVFITMFILGQIMMVLDIVAIGLTFSFWGRAIQAPPRTKTFGTMRCPMEQLRM